MSRLHSDLVKCTVKLLLAMTRVENQERKELAAAAAGRGEEGEEGEGEGGEEGGEGVPRLAITAAGEEESAEQEHIKHIESTTNLKNECIALAQTLTAFTKQLNKCVCIQLTMKWSPYLAGHLTL